MPCGNFIFVPVLQFRLVAMFNPAILTMRYLIYQKLFAVSYVDDDSMIITTSFDAVIDLNYDAVRAAEVLTLVTGRCYIFAIFLL